MTLNEAISSLQDGFSIDFPCFVIKKGVKIFSGSLGELSANLTLCASTILNPKIPHTLSNDSKSLIFHVI